MGADVARLGIGERLELTHPDINLALLLDTPGDLSLLVLTTRFPIDPRLLEQSGYERGETAARGETRSLNPLERLLAAAIRGSGTRTGVSMGTGSWGGALIDYHVRPQTGSSSEIGAVEKE